MYKRVTSPRISLLLSVVALLAVALLHGFGHDGDLTNGPAVAQSGQPLLCRFGYGLAGSIATYDSTQIGRLRAGAYMNWGASASPARPNDIEFIQTVRVKQWKWKDGEYVLADYAAPYAVPHAYKLAPSIDTIKQVAQAAPGSIWLVGNEIDRRDWLSSDGKSTGRQDEILPELYARAYHEVYHAIKSSDPTAQVAIGGIVQATPLRLEYLDKVWNEYKRLYNTPMPVDYWNTHVFILQEVRNSFGADVPPGSDALEGRLYTIDDNRDWSKAEEQILAYRHWMKEHGQQNKPLIISEYGVNFPGSFAGFTPENVRDEFMYPSFDYFLNQKDTSLGYPADDYRLVQRWLWYSLDDDSGDYNGHLFYSGRNEHPFGIAPLGLYWETYVNDASRVPVSVDAKPLGLVASPTFSADGAPITVTLRAQIVNSGSIHIQTPLQVEFWNASASELIGTTTVNTVQGCGEITVASAIWENVTPGVYSLLVKVDSTNVVAESSETNNEYRTLIVIGKERVMLPLVINRY